MTQETTLLLIAKSYTDDQNAPTIVWGLVIELLEKLSDLVDNFYDDDAHVLVADELPISIILDLPDTNAHGQVSIYNSTNGVALPIANIGETVHLVTPELDYPEAVVTQVNLVTKRLEQPQWLFLLKDMDGYLDWVTELAFIGPGQWRNLNRKAKDMGYEWSEETRRWIKGTSRLSHTDVHRQYQIWGNDEETPF